MKSKWIWVVVAALAMFSVLRVVPREYEGYAVVAGVLLSAALLAVHVAMLNASSRISRPEFVGKAQGSIKWWGGLIFSGALMVFFFVRVLDDLAAGGSEARVAVGVVFVSLCAVCFLASSASLLVHYEVSGGYGASPSRLRPRRDDESAQLAARAVALSVEVSRLSYKSGDTVVVKMPVTVMTPRQADDLRKYLDAVLPPDLRIAVIPQGVDLSVIEKAEE